jgi:hypothetical protein
MPGPRAVTSQLSVIGQGTPAHARHFAETQEVVLPLYVSRDRAAHRAAGAKVGELLGPCYRTPGKAEGA